MNILLAISSLIDRLLTGLGRIASYALLLLIVTVVFDVLTRRFFNMGSTQLQEAEWHFHTILIMFFLGTTYIFDQHVRVDLAYATFRPRTRALVELLGILLLLLPFCVVTGYFAYNFAHTSYVRNEVSQSIDGLPYRWAIKSLLPLGLLLLGLAGISRALRAVAVLIDPLSASLTGIGEQPK